MLIWGEARGAVTTHNTMVILQIARPEMGKHPSASLLKDRALCGKFATRPEDPSEDKELQR